MAVPVGSKRYDPKIIKRLRLFYKNNPGVGEKEATKRLGHSRSTIYRYTEHMKEQGLIEKTRLGWKVIE